MTERQEFREAQRFRFMRLGFPIGLALLILVSIVVGHGEPPLIALLVLGAAIVLIAAALAMSVLTAYAVSASERCLEVRCWRGRVFVPWSTVRSLEIADRRQVATPGRMLMLNRSGAPVFVFDSIERFDQLVQVLAQRSSQPVLPMPTWKKIAYLQWGSD